MASHALYARHIEPQIVSRNWEPPELAQKQYIAEAETADTIARYAQGKHSGMARSFGEAANTLSAAKQQTSFDDAQKYWNLGHGQIAEGYKGFLHFHHDAGVDGKAEKNVNAQLQEHFRQELQDFYDTGILAYIKPPVTIEQRGYKLGDWTMKKPLSPHRTEGARWMANTAARFAENPYIKTEIPDARRSMVTAYTILAKVLGISLEPGAPANARLILEKPVVPAKVSEREDAIKAAQHAFEQGLKEVSSELTPAFSSDQSIDEAIDAKRQKQQLLADGFVQQAKQQQAREILEKQNSVQEKTSPTTSHDENTDDQPESSILPTQHFELEGRPVYPPRYTFQSGPLQQ